MAFAVTLHMPMVPSLGRHVQAWLELKAPRRFISGYILLQVFTHLFTFSSLLIKFQILSLFIFYIGCVLKCNGCELKVLRTRWKGLVLCTWCGAPGAVQL